MEEKSMLESLFRMTRCLKRHMDQKVESLSLNIAPMHVRVLMMIRHHPDSTAIDVAHRLNRDKSQVTRLLTTLINENLLQKTPNPSDKRSQILTFTEQGQAVVAEVSLMFETVSRELTEGVSDEDRETFNRVMEHIVLNLNREALHKETDG